MRVALKSLLLALVITLGLNILLPEAYMNLYMLFITHYGLMDSFKKNPQMKELLKRVF